MPKAKPNFAAQVEELGDGLSEEEKAAAAAEERGEPAVQAVPDAEETEPAEQTAEPAETAEGGKKGKKPSVVPYDRFSEVVEERNATRAELEKIRRENAETREQFTAIKVRQDLADAAQKRAQDAAAAEERRKQRPDPDIDPAGARAWDAEQRAIAAEQRVNELQTFVQGRSQQLDSWTQNQQLTGYAQQAANVGRARYTDWDARVDFARAERVKAWMRVGHNEESARNIVQNEEVALLRSAAQTGADLVTAIADMTTQWGYKPANGNARANGQNGNLKLDQISAGQRVQGQGRVQSAQAPAQQPWQEMGDKDFEIYIGDTLSEDEYMEMLKDKKFVKRVNELDLKMAGAR
jgi:hypothetical protein